MPNVRFAYDPDVAARFPSVAGGVAHATGVSNGPSPPELVAAFEAEQQAALARIGETPLSELPTLAAWRRAFRAFGVDPTTYRSAAEALLRRLTKQGSIPSINALVDIGNLVAIRYGLPVAMFDQRTVTGGTTVRFATGTESFTDLGSGDRETPAAGEVIFVDDAGLVSARRWCWRQSAESASGPDTTEVLVTVEGHHDSAEEDVAAASADLDALLHSYAEPDAMTSGIVTARSPGFSGLGSQAQASVRGHAALAVSSRMSFPRRRPSGTSLARRGTPMTSGIQDVTVGIPRPAVKEEASDEVTFAGLLFIILGAAFLTVTMLAASIAPAYDFGGGAISDLGVIDETALLFNVLLVVTGGLNAVGGYLLYAWHRRPWLVVPFILGGAGAIGAGLLPLDTGGLHSLFALAGFLFFNIEGLCFAVVVRGPMKAISVAAGAIGLVFVGVMIVGDAGNAAIFGSIGHGGAERMIVYPVMLWLLTLGGYLIGRPELVTRID